MEKVSTDAHLSTPLTGVFRPLSKSKMERFERIVNGFQLLTIFAKHRVLDIRQGSEYTSVTSLDLFQLH